MEPFGTQWQSLISSRFLNAGRQVEGRRHDAKFSPRNVSDLFGESNVIMIVVSSSYYKEKGLLGSKL